MRTALPPAWPDHQHVTRSAGRTVDLESAAARRFHRIQRPLQPPFLIERHVEKGAKLLWALTWRLSREGYSPQARLRSPERMSRLLVLVIFPRWWATLWPGFLLVRFVLFLWLRWMKSYLKRLFHAIYKDEGDLLARLCGNLLQVFLIELRQQHRLNARPVR